MKLRKNRWIGALIAVTVVMSSLAIGRAESVPANHHPNRILAKPKKAALQEQGKLAQTHAAIGARVRRQFARLHNIQVLELPAQVSVEQAIAHYKRSGLYAYVEPDFEVSVNVIPDDPMFGELWGLHNTGQSTGTPDADIDAPEAWDTTVGTNQIIVAVIDTGIDYTHPELASMMWTNPGEIPGNGIDDDGNGYVDDVYGINAITGSGDPLDDFFHGTHVAGTIGAVRGNGVGVAGVARNVRLMSCKFLGSDGGGYIDDAIECVNYAVAHGASIMNNSWGCPAGYDCYSQAMRDAIAAARDADSIFVAAAGNDGVDTDVYHEWPAGYEVENVVSVAATTRNDELAEFSNYGLTTVDLGAPGKDILSTFPTYMTYAMSYYGLSTNYATISGTSMATPHVAGALAVLKSEQPSPNYAALMEQLYASVDLIPALAGKCVTGGRLNVAKLLIPPSHDAGGRVTDSSGSGMQGVMIYFTSGGGDAPVAVATDANGNWTQTDFVFGTNYRATAVLAGHTFTPSGRDFRGGNMHVDFVDTTGCNFAVSPSEQTFGGNGGSGMINVTTDADCPWVGTSDVNWIVLTSPSGTGSGALHYIVSSNPNATPRTGMIHVGGSEITITELEAGTCLPSSIHIGDTLNGELSTADCGSHGNASHYADLYTFTANAGTPIFIEVNSGAFDTFVYLIGPNGAVITFDDDGGQGVNSRIPANSGYFRLPASGTFVIEVTSYYAGATGNYTVSLQDNPIQRLSDKLSESSGHVRDASAQFTAKNRSGASVQLGRAITGVQEARTIADVPAVREALGYSYDMVRAQIDSLEQSLNLTKGMVDGPKKRTRQIRKALMTNQGQASNLENTVHQLQ